MSPTPQPGPLRRFLWFGVAPAFVVALIRVLNFTWRFEEVHRERFDACRASGRPLVAGFLHGRIFPLLHRMSRPVNGRWLSMCSKSLDGEAMARVEEAFGFEVVRGSSGRDGLQAVVEMIRRVRRDSELGACLAVDGSRGPRGRVQGGVVSLAQRTGASLLPVTASARPAHIFTRAWDRTLLPLPFARVVVAYGEPIDVAPKLTPAAFDAVRVELESAFAELQAEADGIAGFGDREPVAAAETGTL